VPAQGRLNRLLKVLLALSVFLAGSGGGNIAAEGWYESLICRSSHFLRVSRCSAADDSAGRIPLNISPGAPLWVYLTKKVPVRLDES
jgi:hypothetical protein